MRNRDFTRLSHMRVRVRGPLCPFYGARLQTGRRGPNAVSKRQVAASGPAPARLVIEARLLKKGPPGMSIRAFLVRRHGEGRGKGFSARREEKELEMRFLSMVKTVEGDGKVPPPELVEEVERFAEQATKDGTMVMRGGLFPSATSVRVRLENGQIRVIDGPYAEVKEVIGGFSIFDLKSKQEAIDAAVAFMEITRKLWPGWEGECELRQMWGPEDFPPP